MVWTTRVSRRRSASHGGAHAAVELLKIDHVNIALASVAAGAVVMTTMTLKSREGRLQLVICILLQSSLFATSSKH